MGKKLSLFKCDVVGTGYDELWKSYNACAEEHGEIMPLYLEHDANNKHDKHALKVMSFINGKPVQIGWVPKQYSPQLFKYTAISVRQADRWYWDERQDDRRPGMSIEIFGSAIGSVRTSKVKNSNGKKNNSSCLTVFWVVLILLILIGVFL